MELSMTEPARLAIARLRARAGATTPLLITRRPRSEALTVAVIRQPGVHDLRVDGAVELFCGPVAAERLLGRVLDHVARSDGRHEFVPSDTDR